MLMSEMAHGNSLLQHIAQFKLLFSHVYIFKQKKMESCFGSLFWKKKKSILVMLEEYSSELKLFFLWKYITENIFNEDSVLDQGLGEMI